MTLARLTLSGFRQREMYFGFSFIWTWQGETLASDSCHSAAGGGGGGLGCWARKQKQAWEPQGWATSHRCLSPEAWSPGGPGTSGSLLAPVPHLPEWPGELQALNMAFHSWPGPRVQAGGWGGGGGRGSLQNPAASLLPHCPHSQSRPPGPHPTVSRLPQAHSPPAPRESGDFPKASTRAGPSPA